MADVKTLRTQDELDLIEKTFGSTYLETQSFELSRRACLLQAQRDENARLLKAFTEFCEEHGVLWFVFGDTLRGVIAYQNYLPGKVNIDLGMLRADQQKFEEVYFALSEPQRANLPWVYEPFFKGTETRRIFAHVHFRNHTFVRRNGHIVYDADQLPEDVQGQMQIAVFDKVPDDFFTRKKFYRQMKRRNSLIKKTIQAHGLGKAGQESGFKWVAKPPRPFKLVPLKFASWSMHHLARRYEGRETRAIARVSGWRSVTLPLTDIGQTHWLDFSGVKVRCPVRPDVWAKEPVYEATPELKRLQNDAKTIVTEIDRVCRELGIKYFACGGTMLGHVRHGGFIPWDDDIDVGMLRADYEVFKAKAGKLIDADRFFLQTRETDPTIPYLFSKVRLNDSKYITEYNRFRPFHKGICVDVFPFDYVPTDVAELKAFQSEVLAASKQHNRVANRQYTREQAAELPTDRKNLGYLISQVNGRLLAHHFHNISLKDTQAAYDRTATRYNADHERLGLRFVASFVPSYTMALVTDLFPTQRVEFDEIEVEIPNNPEIFLAMQYGDFMVMPYPHQRAGHDLLLWSDEEGVGGGHEAENLEEGLQWG